MTGKKCSEDSNEPKTAIEQLLDDGFAEAYKYLRATIARPEPGENGHLVRGQFIELQMAELIRIHRHYDVDRQFTVFIPDEDLLKGSNG